METRETDKSDIRFTSSHSLPLAQVASPEACSQKVLDCRSNWQGRFILVHCAGMNGVRLEMILGDRGL